MFDLEKIETTLGPRGTNAAFAVIGVMLSQLWSQFRARRICLSWTANFQQITPQGTDPIFSKIQVSLHSQPYQNLYSCQIIVLNESSRDIDEFDILITFRNSYLILHGQGAISTSGKNLLASQSFQETTRRVLNVPEVERPNHESYNYIVQNREFHLPSLNRGSTATFTFLINSMAKDQIASVIVTTEKKGVKLLSRPAQPFLFGAPLKMASPVGILFSVILVFFVSNLALNPTTLTCFGFAIGACALLLGILLIHFFRILKKLFG